MGTACDYEMERSVDYLIPLMPIIPVWIFFGFVTSIVAWSRGRSFIDWLFYGTFFGVFALIRVVALPSLKAQPGEPTPETHLRCPDCQELVFKTARVCKHCGCRLVPQP